MFYYDGSLTSHNSKKHHTVPSEKTVYSVKEGKVNCSGSVIQNHSAIDVELEVKGMISH